MSGATIFIKMFKTYVWILKENVEEKNDYDSLVLEYLRLKLKRIFIRFKMTIQKIKKKMILMKIKL